MHAQFMYRCGSIFITENSHPPLAAFFKPHTLGLSMSNFPVPEHMEQGSTSPCLLCARIDLARIMTANYIYPKQSIGRYIPEGFLDISAKEEYLPVGWVQHHLVARPGRRPSLTLTVAKQKAPPTQV